MIVAIRNQPRELYFKKEVLMLIRNLTEDDFEAFNEILCQWIEDGHDKLPDYFRSISEINYQGGSRHEHEHCYVNNKRFYNLVAEEESGIVGIISVMIHDNENTHPLVIHHSWLEIYHFWVTDPKRKSEIFGMFQRKVREFAKEKNIRRIIMELPHSDLDTIHMLETVNYKPAYTEFYFDFDLDTPPTDAAQAACATCNIQAANN